MRFKTSEMNNTLRTAVFDVKVQDVILTVVSTVDDEMYIPPPCTKGRVRERLVFAL